MSTETNLKNRRNDVPERTQQRPSFAPPVDIFENKDELLILADLPGVAKEDLAIHLDKDQLTLEGLRKEAQGQEAFDYRRVFVVPHGIDAGNISANLQNGVLRVVLPKPAALKPRQIEVKAS